MSAEVVRLQNEKTAEDHRVLFSQVLFSLREEIVPPTESFASQLRAAATSGLMDAASTLAGILFFVVSRGPAILLWVVLLYFSSCWAWRMWQRFIAKDANAGLGQGA